MLSIKPVKSVGDAASYYSAGDNYYLSSQGELVDASLWYGRGATSLGLKGIVDPDRFIQLLSGKLPTGQQIGVFDKNGMLQHRPATDITLSAPKSISNMALVGGDERLMQAHLEGCGVHYLHTGKMIKLIQTMDLERLYMKISIILGWYIHQHLPEKFVSLAMTSRSRIGMGILK